MKLATSRFPQSKAVVIYGFDYPDRSLHLMIEAFELLAARRVRLGVRQAAPLGPLVHGRSGIRGRREVSLGFGCLGAIVGAEPAAIRTILGNPASERSAAQARYTSSLREIG